MCHNRLTRSAYVTAGALLLAASLAYGATYRDVYFGRAEKMLAPVNGSGGTGNGFSLYTKDRSPTITRDGKTLVWQSYLVKNPNWVNDTNNAYYVVQSTRTGWGQPWSAPAQIISSAAGDDPRSDYTPSISADGLRLLYNDNTTQGAAGNGREPLKIASRLTRGDLFDHAEVVDIVDRRFQDVIDIYGAGTDVYFDQYRCSLGASPQQRWPAYPSDGCLGRCGRRVYFFASDIWTSRDWEFLGSPPPPWPIPGFFNKHISEQGYQFRGEPLTFAPGPLNGQDAWSATDGVSIVNRSRDAMEANQFIEWSSGVGDQVAERNTGNTTTGEDAQFTSRFGLLGTGATASAVIELGHDAGGIKNVFARIELNRTIANEFAAVDGDGAGSGTPTQISLLDVNTGGGGCSTFPVSYQQNRWYLVEVTATASSSASSYTVTIRNPLKFGPLTNGSCSLPEQDFVRMGQITGMRVVTGTAGIGPLNFVRITGGGIRVDAGPTCSAFRTLGMFTLTGLLQAEALPQPQGLTTLPLYGEVRSLRLRSFDQSLTPNQLGPARTNSTLSGPFLTDDERVIYFSSNGYWSSGAYAPPDGCPGGCGEDDGYYGYAQPVLWRGHRSAIADKTTPLNQTVKLGDAQPIFCPGVFNLRSASQQLLDPELASDGLYFSVAQMNGGTETEVSIWHAPIFGDLDADGDVDAADAAAIAAIKGGTYDVRADYNLDGVVDAADDAAFNHNLGYQAGDIDGDGDVDYADFLLLKAAVGDTICGEAWNQAADVNFDLALNDADFQKLKLNYGLGVPGGAGSLPPLPAHLFSPFAADFDTDGDVDLSDFGHFQSCFNGPNRPPTASGCDNADFDADQDIDLTDFGVFQSCFNGPNRPPACQ